MARRKSAKRVIGIDAGTTKSALVLYNPRTRTIDDYTLSKNDQCLTWLRKYDRANTICAIEQIKSYGNLIGDSLLETCVWNGRFREAWGTSVIWIPRKTVCGHICHNARANDANVRQALIDMFPPTGGGKTPQIGLKHAEGPLYGMKRDLWSALAVAITAHMQVKQFEAEIGL